MPLWPLARMCAPWGQGFFYSFTELYHSLLPQCAYLKCTTQRFLGSSQSCVSIAMIDFRTSPSPRKEAPHPVGVVPNPLSSHSSPPCLRSGSDGGSYPLCSLMCPTGPATLPDTRQTPPCQGQNLPASSQTPGNVCSIWMEMRSQFPGHTSDPSSWPADT